MGMIIGISQIKLNKNTSTLFIHKKRELIEREKKLKSLAEVWKRERIVEEESSSQLFGFTKNSEVLTGRLAMFFLITGLLTEIWTKQTITGQIDTMLRIIGLV